MKRTAVPKKKFSIRILRIGMAVLPALFLPCGASRAQDAAARHFTPALAGCGQMLVVIPETAAGPHASLSFYEKEAAGWRRVLGPHPVLIGSKGWAWGRGPLFSAPPGPTKREGDLKAPAGVFALGKAYGRDAGFATRWPYVALSQDIRAIEDPASRYYNQVVDRRTIPAARQDWRQSVGLGKFLVFIEHNWPAPVPGAGSALFLHVWESPGTPSFGCTVAAEAVVRAVIARLDPTRQARLALLPREYLPAVFR